jgi:putative transposase
MGYPSDLTDKEWVMISGFFIRGNRSLHEKRNLVDAVRYITKTGCQWRQLPKDFPHWSTVHSFFRRARLSGLWEVILKNLVKKSREKMGRSASPSYSIIDSQSTKTTSDSDDRGIDGGKKNKRKKATHSN